MMAIFRFIGWIISLFYIAGSDEDGIYEDISNKNFQTLGSIRNYQTRVEKPPNKIVGFTFLLARFVLILVFIIMIIQALGMEQFPIHLAFFPMIIGVLEYLAYQEREFPYSRLQKQAEADEVEAKPDPSPDNSVQVVVYTISVPKLTDWSSQQSVAFMSQLIGIYSAWDFVIHATADGIRWEIWDWALHDPSVLQVTMRANLPEAEIHIEARSVEENPETVYRYTESYRQANMFLAPLTYITDIRKVDPLNPMINAMNNLRQGEHIYFVISLAGRASQAVYKRGQKLITRSTIHPLQYLSSEGRSDAIAQKINKSDRIRKFVGTDQEVFEGKLKSTLLNAVVLIQVDAPEKERVFEIGATVSSQMSHFVHEPYNALLPIYGDLETDIVFVNDAKTNQQSHFREARLNAPLLILEPLEIATLWHLPHKEMTASRVIWARNIQPIPEQIVRNDAGINLGYGYQDLSSPVDIILPEEDRITHMSIVGRTRMGKSNLMHHLIHQDITNGKGVAVIDPHGKLVEDILRTSIPQEREKDVILLDLADKEYPPPLNPLNQASHSTLLGVVSIIEKLFPDTEERARLSQTLRATLQLLEYQPQANMRDAVRILMDDEFRNALLDQSDNPEIIDYWDFQYNNASSGQKAQLADPIVNRIRPFYGNTYLYPVICHPDRIDFQQVISDKKIVLISLASDEYTVPKQERELIGSMLISRLQIAGMRQKEGDPFYIYIDEVQRFATTSLDTVFSEAAKYKLSLTIAHQYLEQLEGDLLNSILGNVGTNIVFRCSPKDSGKLMQYMQPEYKKHELANLDKYQAAVKMQVEAQTQPAFTLFPHPPLEEPNDADERVARLRKQAHQQLRSREDVLAWLNERYPRVARRGRSADKKPESSDDNNSTINPDSFVEDEDN